MERWRFQLYGLLGLIWMLPACAGNESASEVKMGSVTCHLEINQSFPNGDPVVVSISLNNATSENLEVLQYFTPLEGVMSNVFLLEYANEELAYRGPLVKRGPPTDADWLKLDAGSVLSAEVDISNAWDLGRAGEYSLQLRKGISYRQLGNSQINLLSVANCGKLSFSVN